MTDGQRRRSAQWAGQFLVAAELERNGYDVAFTMGNTTPVADLMVGHSATGEQFWVDVKAQWEENAWWGKPKLERKRLFYVLVKLSKAYGEDRFFVLTQQEFNALVENYRTSHPNQKPVGGFDWNYPRQYKGEWSKLPSWGQSPN